MTKHEISYIRDTYSWTYGILLTKQQISEMPKFIKDSYLKTKGFFKYKEK